MAYDRSLLHAGEDVVLDLHPHWWFITPATAGLVVSLLLGIVAFANDWPEPVALFFGLVILVALGYFGIRYAKWVSTNFVLTTDRLIYRSGVLAKSGIEIPLDKVNTVFFQQSIFGRMLGFGTLRIESASETGTQDFFEIRKPSAVQNEIYRQMNDNVTEHYDRIGEAASSAVNASAAGSAAATSIPEQIEKLDDLRARGVISDEEFQAKKAQLLDRM